MGDPVTSSIGISSLVKDNPTVGAGLIGGVPGLTLGHAAEGLLGGDSPSVAPGGSTAPTIGAAPESSIPIPQSIPFPSVANPVFRNQGNLFFGSPFQPFFSTQQQGFTDYGRNPGQFFDSSLNNQISQIAKFYQNQGNFNAPTLFS